MTFISQALSHLGVLLGLAVLVASTTGGARQAAPPASPEPSVAVGSPAPDFTLAYLIAKAGGGFETRDVTLSSFKGRQNVVLAFFPAAFSPG